MRRRHCGGAKPQRASRIATRASSLEELLSDPGARLGGAAVLGLVATHPLWLKELGLKKPKGGRGGEGAEVVMPTVESRADRAARQQREASEAAEAKAKKAAAAAAAAAAKAAAREEAMAAKAEAQRAAAEAKEAKALAAAEAKEAKLREAAEKRAAKQREAEAKAAAREAEKAAREQALAAKQSPVIEEEYYEDEDEGEEYEEVARRGGGGLFAMFGRQNTVQIEEEEEEEEEEYEEVAPARSKARAVVRNNAVPRVKDRVTAGDEIGKRTGGRIAADDKAEVKEYFNTAGFDRWRKIYGETDDVNKVQLDIRNGHQVTVDTIIDWMEEDGVKGRTVCDAGCGTGSLAIPLGLMGAKVTGSDISESMVGEAAVRAKEAGLKGAKFFPSDLESLKGKWNTVTCVDVLIHYPQDKADDMIAHLSGLAQERVILSFAPKTFYYDTLKRFGELFPGPSKTTRAYLHRESDVVAALEANGFEVTRRALTAKSFYFSQILEAERVA